MGRPPCCEKIGIKKGPWTPEEDIILVSYIQQHGPGNWRSVPTNTGLIRCSKSCRLRWTNYLRPGIKRGNFTSHEEGMIIHLQALLGNKWAAIASYLPERTDNDIKNYWNTHLKKKLKKFQSTVDPFMASSSANTQFLSNKMNDNSISSKSSSSSVYASSTENISRLLEGWMRSSNTCSSSLHKGIQSNGFNNIYSSGMNNSLHQCCCNPKTNQEYGDLILREEFESIENLKNVSWDNKSCSDTSSKSFQNADNNEKGNVRSDLENWLMDEISVQVEEMMELSHVF